MGVRKQAPDKGTLTRMRDGAVEATIAFQYNPTILRRTRGAKWKFQMPPGGVLPIPQHTSADVETLEIELLLDAREHVNRNHVRYQMAFYESMVVAQLGESDEVISQFRSAPIGLLVFGRRSWYVVVTRLSIEEQIFDLELTPVRARIRLSMTGVFVGGEEQEQAMLDLQDDALQADNVTGASSATSNATGG